MGLITQALSEASDEQLAGILRQQPDEHLARIFRILPIATQIELATSAESGADARAPEPEEPVPADPKPRRQRATAEQVLERLAPGSTRWARDLEREIGADPMPALRRLKADGVVRAVGKMWRRDDVASASPRGAMIIDYAEMAKNGAS